MLMRVVHISGHFISNYGFSNPEPQTKLRSRKHYKFPKLLSEIDGLMAETELYVGD